MRSIPWPKDAQTVETGDFVADIAALRRVIEAGQLNPLAVELVSPGGIERIQRTGKIRRVIDRRLS